MEKVIDFDNVADLYDSYVYTDFDISFYKEFCKGYANVLELMCGTGRVSIPLLEAGVPLTCVDYSEKMLQVFRSKVDASLHEKIICQDVCNLNLNTQFDLVMIPFNSIAEITDARKREQAIQAIYRHLFPGGKFFCTLYNPAYRIKAADGNMRMLGKFPIENGTLIVSYHNSYSDADRIISGTQFYEVYKGNSLKEKRYLDIRFSVITKDEILSAASCVGFSTKEICGDYQGGAYHEDSMFMNFLFEK